MATQFKQKVAIAAAQDGTQVYITIEWLRMLTARFAEILAEASAGSTSSSTTTSAADHAALVALEATVAAQGVLIAALQAQSTDYEARLRALEGGYQV